MGYKGRLYKFKQANSQNIDALKSNKLWISNIYMMNDPMDLGFYIDNNKISVPYETKDIIEFQKYITTKLFCASFTTIYSNKRLWNYYSDGFSGFVLGYKSSDIKAALNKIKLYGSEKAIKYTNKKDFNYTEMFKKYLNNEIMDNYIEWKSLFTKDMSWREEKEYRFSLNTPRIIDEKAREANGFLIDIKPSVIIVGYKLNKKDFDVITEYCKINNVSLKMYLPKFETKKIDYRTIDIKL